MEDAKAGGDSPDMANIRAVCRRSEPEAAICAGGDRGLSAGARDRRPRSRRPNRRPPEDGRPWSRRACNRC